MPRIHTDVRLDQATAEFGPYVDSYWRDFDHDPVYAVTYNLLRTFTAA